MSVWSTARDTAVTGLVVVGTVKVALVAAPLAVGGFAAKGAWDWGSKFLFGNAKRNLDNYYRLPEAQKDKALGRQMLQTALLQADIGLGHAAANHFKPTDIH